ncbi:ABC transporter ATP-binding protein [Inhella gelatinilytica]|uniref:ABC transporter ATP-binding protein n=1 Tax=Inhella gelatinilytica TaxID=2795030 RepID=A0A931NAK0_9BURK|nr:ABC transporter ATP-binding protein [Inhella gelatinilytica]MBH9552558.1 ABC transporter ATP-binding protein [Inhella gelatinilytica]
MFLTLDQVNLQYTHKGGAVAAVQNASLRLGRGEIGVLIGPSGCGKTSLLRAIAGLERLHSGSIHLGGEALAVASQNVHRPPEDRRVGLVFQDFALFPHLSVADNVAFGLRHLPPAPRQARVDEMLALVGLEHAHKRMPHQLSGGQQQRVALARALAPAPALLLLDEPFSSLDVDLRESLSQDLRAILKASHTTALFVTHDQAEAFAIGDRVGVMQSGHLEQWDEPYTVYHRPATRFVARFIGHGVFLPGHLEGEHGAQVRTALGLLDNAQDCPVPSAYPDGRCEVLLRADDVVHDDDAPVQACIEHKVFRGAEFLYTLRLQDGTRLVATVPSHHNHHVGEWIGIRTQVDHVVTFATPA